MASQVADDVQSIITSAIEAYGSAALAIPGGKTPVPIFRELVGRNLDWSVVTLLPTDDRLVPIDHPLSNAGLIRTYFGSTEATLLTLFEGRGGADAVDRSADKKLRSLRWPLDLVWLGMGEDGHTASMFPGTTAMHESERLVVAVWVEKFQQHRITMTPVVLNNAAEVQFLVAGASKVDVLPQVIAGPYEPDRLPSQYYPSHGAMPGELQCLA